MGFDAIRIDNKDFKRQGNFFGQSTFYISHIMMLSQKLEEKLSNILVTGNLLNALTSVYRNVLFQPALQEEELCTILTFRCGSGL